MIRQNLVFTPIVIAGQPLGYERRTSTHLYFFGTRHATIEILQARYPNFSWGRMRQVHGHALARLPDEKSTPEADAIWTTQKNLALIVSTADCLPLLIGHNNFSAAIHAGWRGVLSEIAVKSIDHMLAASGSSAANTDVFVGPHIHQKNFEFSRSEGAPFVEMAARFSLGPNIIINDPKPDKVRISLKDLVHAQLQSRNIENVAELLLDTFESSDFHSYRRDRIPGRNLSFVARLTDA